jgi:hypothetical protein
MSLPIQPSTIFDALEGALKLAGTIEGLVSESERKSIQERIDRGRAAIKDPIAVSADDAARKEALERAIRGEG